MSESLLDKPDNDSTGSLDGLEPPMFDETWDPAGSGITLMFGALPALRFSPILPSQE